MYAYCIMKYIAKYPDGRVFEFEDQEALALNLRISVRSLRRYLKDGRYKSIELIKQTAMDVPEDRTVPVQDGFGWSRNENEFVICTDANGLAVPVPRCFYKLFCDVPFPDRVNAKFVKHWTDCCRAIAPGTIRDVYKLTHGEYKDLLAMGSLDDEKIITECAQCGKETETNFSKCDRCRRRYHHPCVPKRCECGTELKNVLLYYGNKFRRKGPPPYLGYST